MAQIEVPISFSGFCYLLGITRRLFAVHNTQYIMYTDKINPEHPEGKYDGIWANASLLHLLFNEIEEFVCQASDYLNPNGVLYISMKTGIQTGCDNNGRFFTDFSEEKVQQIVAKSTAFIVIDSWETGDGLSREGLRWINLILKKSEK